MASLTRDEYRARKAIEDWREYADMRREERALLQATVEGDYCRDCQGDPAVEVVHNVRVCAHCAAYRRGELC